MSEIRKIRRMMDSFRNPRKFKTKLTYVDIFLIIGFTLFLLGTITGIMNYLFYSGGRPNLIISNEVDGSIPLDAQPPGNPVRKDTVILCAIIAGAGLILSISALLTKLTLKNLRQQTNIQQ